MNKTYVLFGILLLGSFAFAMTGATISGENDLTRWTSSTTAGTNLAQAGNITQVNISTGNSLTTRWASYHGDVANTAIILAANNSPNVYSWTYSATNTGEVCVSPNNAFTFGTAEASTGAEVDTAWGFPITAQDRAAVTFTGSTPINIQGVAINSPSINHADSTFNTVVLDNGSVSSMNNFAFCTQIASNTAIATGTADYQLVVPVTTGSTQTYSFFMELE